MTGPRNDGVVGAARDGARAGLRKAVDELLERVRPEIPVGDPAADPDPRVNLATSIRVEEDGDGLLVVVSAPHAAKQHEDQRLRHPRGGKPKYLEAPLKALIPDLEQIIGSSVAAHMKRDAVTHARAPSSRLQRAA